MERDDNSKVMPGKKDFKKVAKAVSKQKRILNNYLRNLHLKLISENFNIKISLSSFCHMRPTHLSLINYTSRNACLCTKHQNFALKLKAITSVGGKLRTNSDTVAKLSIEEISSLVNGIAVDKVVFSAWKKVDIAF